MENSEFYSLTPREKRQFFFNVATRVNLVVDGHYISGIPKGTENDVNLFYRLEDNLGYPKPCKIPKTYLPKN
jgi:hypothetical protein